MSNWWRGRCLFDLKKNELILEAEPDLKVCLMYQLSLKIQSNIR